MYNHKSYYIISSFPQELEKFDQYIFADCTDFINVENVYEDILKKTLTPEVNKGQWPPFIIHPHSGHSDTKDSLE